MTISDRIRNRRLELGLSVDDLANRLGKNRATVYRYESGDIKNYSNDVMIPLAKALQTNPAYLFGFDDPDPLDESAAYQPKNSDVRLVVRDLNRLTPSQLQQAKAVLHAMFASTNPDLFT